MTDKSNKRPWDDPEDAVYEAQLKACYAKYPRMQENMAFYASIMERGAAFSLLFAAVVHWLCTEFIQLHIRTPLWVWRVAFVSLCFLGGYAATATISGLLAARSVTTLLLWPKLFEGKVWANHRFGHGRGDGDGDGYGDGGSE